MDTKYTLSFVTVNLAIVDYHLGNLTSLDRALSHLEISHVVTSDPDVISNATHIILPGVGSFARAMQNIQDLNLTDSLNNAFRNSKPILGICLGFQILATSGTEPSFTDGLAFVDSQVHLIEAVGSYKIPHIGWNTVKVAANEDPLFSGIPDNTYFYFCHSYHMMAKCSNVVTSTVDYGQSLCASIRVNNLFGVQFHPEKSQRHGLRMLLNFSSL